jgi:hypothetical protein
VVVGGGGGGRWWQGGVRRCTQGSQKFQRKERCQGGQQMCRPKPLSSPALPASLVPPPPLLLLRLLWGVGAHAPGASLPSWSALVPRAAHTRASPLSKAVHGWAPAPTSCHCCCWHTPMPFRSLLGAPCPMDGGIAPPPPPSFLCRVDLQQLLAPLLPPTRHMLEGCDHCHAWWTCTTRYACLLLAAGARCGALDLPSQAAA